MIYSSYPQGCRRYSIIVIHISMSSIHTRKGILPCSQRRDTQYRQCGSGVPRGGRGASLIWMLSHRVKWDGDTR